MKKVLILSGTASAINYILSLRGSEYELHVTDSDTYSPGLYMPGVTSHVVPRARSTEAYRTAVDHIVRNSGIDFIVPTSDYDVDAILAFLHDGWTPNTRLFRPPWESFQILRDKRKLMAHMQRHLPDIVPYTWPAGTDPKDVSFPVVVKPVAESGGKGVSIVENAEELQGAISRARALFGGDPIVQQYVPGSTYVETLVYDHHGFIRTAVSMRSQLTFFTWGGGGCAGETVFTPDLHALSARLIAACGGWRGPINVEWRRSSEGLWFILEANCRLNGYSYLTTMNGLSLPHCVMDALADHDAPQSYPDPYQGKNFVIGYRAMAIEGWPEPDLFG